MKQRIEKIPFWVWFWLVLVASIPLKLAAAQNMPFDIDYVPVTSRIDMWLNGGAFPVYGTLSSVAAYNMPALQWLHMPAYLITRNAGLSMLITMLLFNLISTWAVFRLGKRMFSPSIGLIAATLFTFSETGISSSYIAWAQQLLPGFYVLVVLCLWEWSEQGKGIYLALSGVIATLAVMTHFSAVVLFPAMLLFAILRQVKWQWGYLAGGAIAVILLLMPYMLFQVERDFADLRAFLTQESLVQEIRLEELAYLKPEGGDLPLDYRNPIPVTEEISNEPTAEPRYPNIPVWFKDLGKTIIRLPQIFYRVTNLAFAMGDAGLQGIHPNLAMLAQVTISLSTLLFWTASIRIILRWLQADQKLPTASDISLLIFIFILILTLLFTGNQNQPTYFMGLVGLQFIIVASWFDAKNMPNLWRIILVGFVALFVLTNSTERSARLIQHDNAVFTPYNVGIYRHVDGTARAIADDWQRDTVTISYDILPEMRTLWWVVAWHSIDDHYRMGMNFDYLLQSQYGVTNTNDSPFGLADNPDYIIVYGESGLSRYDVDQYRIMREGAIYILKPLE